jgi:Zn-dependent protease with chaperone function
MRSAVYFDGLRPVPKQASLELLPDGLRLSVDGGPPFNWPYEAIRLDAPDEAPKLFYREQHGAGTGEQLVVNDPALAAEIITACPALKGDALERKKSRNRIIGWSAAAVASLVLLIGWGLPVLATSLAPLVPWRTEAALGNAIADDIAKSLTGGTLKVCTHGPEHPSQKALDAMVARLSAHASLPGPITVRVLDTAMTNAFALPGGHIFLLKGLITNAEHPDEVAGVLAHEMGHVVNRDAMRRIIHVGGLSFLVGTLLGDFTGSTALVFVSKTLLGNRYSRENETDADAYAITLMGKAGGDVRQLGKFLERVAKFAGERRMELLLSHPVTDDRVAEINKAAPAQPGPSVLSPDEWQALRKICG